MGTVNVVEVNVALCKALGLEPEHVKAITIRLVAMDAPRVDVEFSRRYVAEHPELAETIAKFELVPVTEPASLGQEWDEPLVLPD